MDQRLLAGPVGVQETSMRIESCIEGSAPDFLFQNIVTEVEQRVDVIFRGRVVPTGEYPFVWDQLGPGAPVDLGAITLHAHDSLPDVFHAAFYLIKLGNEGLDLVGTRAKFLPKVLLLAL